LLTIIKNTTLLTLFLLIMALDFSRDFIVKALLFSLITAIISYVLIPAAKNKKKFKLKFYFFYYIIWLVKEIFVASLQMIKIIITPGSLNITPVVNKVDTKQESDQAKTIFANSITLTPGTIAIKAEETDTIDVHTISESHFSSLKKSPMDSLINKSQKS